MLRRKIIALLIVALCLFAAAPVWSEGSQEDERVIGISFGDLQLERWKRDLNFMLDRAKEIGEEVYYTSADGDAQLQVSQIENMLTRGVDVIIVMPVNGKVVGSAVSAAHDDGVKVIAYDRLLDNCDLDYYITFDMLGVGKLQAQYLIDRVPVGKYFLLAGPKDDNNARLFREGQMIVLQDHIDSGNVEVVGDQWAEGWLSDEAMKLSENVLTANNNDIDVVLASNDSTANGAVQALIEQGLAGRILVTGQDADLAACQRIVAGTQTMSVYKPLPLLAGAAVDLAVDIMDGKRINTNATYSNGKIDVPSINLDITAVDKDNILDTVIADGFHSLENVYKNIPRSEWPE